MSNGVFGGQVFELVGMSEILDALETLSPKTLLNVIKSVQRKALTKNVVKPLRSAYPYSDRSTKFVKIINDKNDKYSSWAGFSTEGYLVRWLEYGTEDRYTKKGWHRGKIDPRPFVVPFLEDQAESVVEFFNEDFGTEIDKILTKKLKYIAKKNAI